MSNIVYLAPPAHGHVNPTLPVVQELVERGEQVTYYNIEEFRPQIERTGATFRAYLETEMTSKAIAELLHDGNIARISALILRATEHLLPFMLDQFSREKPDLVVFDSLALWGKMATNILKLRSAASISHFIFQGTHEMITVPGAFRLVMRGLKLVPAILAGRQRLVRQHGKAAFSPGPLFPLHGDVNIVFTARELQPDTFFIDQTFYFVGPSINPQTRYDDFPFDALSQHPIVYISLGTIQNAQPTFYRQCFEAFTQYPAQFILSTGRQIDIKELGDIPSNFIVRPSVPQLEVLQRVDAFITHGGMNSIHEGLLYGVPLILVPQQFEQLLNAHCVARRGAGLVLSDQLRRGHMASEDLRKALDGVLSELRYREAAGAVQKLLRATGGYRQAADELQAHIARC